MSQLCPRDGTALVGRLQFDIQAFACPQCQGCWLPDEGVREAFALLPGTQLRQGQFYERVRREGGKTAVKCGACDSPMLAITHHGVEIDVCPGCGIWFDGGELRKFLAGKEARTFSPGAIAGAAGLATLGAAGLAASAGADDNQREAEGSSTLGAIVDVVDAGASVGAGEVVGEAVGGAFSLIGDLFSSF